MRNMGERKVFRKEGASLPTFIKGLPISVNFLLSFLVLCIGWVLVWSFYLEGGSSDKVYESLSSFKAYSSHVPAVDLSLVILTYRKFKLLDLLLASLQNQELDKQLTFEVILVDNGCLPETKAVFGFYKNPSNHIYKYISRCDNPGYAVGNNFGVTSLATGKWLLFLNDDLVLQPDFLQQYFNLLSAKHPNLAAIGCLLLNRNATQVIEAGSIIWKDASCAGYGRDRRDLNASDLSYPRPVDYVSGACLMIDHATFLDYGGFDGAHFPNYYEDTDLQMHVQHDLGKEVWLQPQAVALHAEHGSFGAQESALLMQNAAKKFKKRWKKELMEHQRNPHSVLMLQSDQASNQVEVAYHRASDLRARRKPSILYIETAFANPAMGSGYGRAYDNLGMLARDLGHKVTATSIQPNDEKWCNDECRQSIRKWGIELVDTGSKDALQAFMDSRIGFYDVLLVSRPTTFAIIYEVLRDQFIKNRGRFAILYDCESLWFRRDEKLIDLMENKHMGFPGAPEGLRSKPHLWRHAVHSDRVMELTWIQMSDVIVSVSDSEARVLKELVEDKDNKNGVTTFTIGHIIEAVNSTTYPMDDLDFQSRSGILFLASFHEHMYYNGDAIWYFLKEVFPLIVMEEDSIQLTIAGRGIPQELRDFVKKKREISNNVLFLESPISVEPLYAKTRVVLAPHLYGSGIQFKITEAWSYGLPVAMSSFSAESLGITPESNVGCVGKDAQSLKDCIVSIHMNEKHWKSSHKSTLEYIRLNYDRLTLGQIWARALESAIAKRKARTLREDACEAKKANCPDDLLGFLKKDYQSPTEACRDGEEMYLSLYPDVAEAVSAGKLESGFFHYQQWGRESYRIFICDSTKISIFKQCTENCINEMEELRHGITTIDVISTEACEEGEEIYKLEFPDVRDAVKEGVFSSAFEHWKNYGSQEGRKYYCTGTVKKVQV